MKPFSSLVLACCACVVASAQSGGWKFPCPQNEIARYTAQRAAGPIHIDGKLDEPSWKAAATSPRFVDIITGGPVIHDTRAAVLWDDEYLYVAYRVAEPFVHAKFTNHNDFIYQDNDVECFIAGPDAYYEFEINAFNTCYEVFFVWEDTFAQSGLSKLPEFERAKLVPFNGVGLTNHVRGGRLGNFNHALPGLKTAVHIDGTINDDTDRDRGWTVELAFPWKSLKWLATDGRALPPKDGDVWRMDFSRFNTYKEAPPAKDPGGWFWTRHGVWDSHIPECFAYITFSTNSVQLEQAPATTPPMAPSQTPLIRLQPRREAPIPHRWSQAHNMPIQKSDGTAPVVARFRATPIRVVVRDPAIVGGVVARVVKDPAARLFRGGFGHTQEWIGGVDRLGAGIGYVGDAGRFGNGPAHTRPLRVGPGSKVAAAEAEVHAIIRDAQIGGACGVLLDKLIEGPAADRTKEEVRCLLVG